MACWTEIWQKYSKLIEVNLQFKYNIDWLNHRLLAKLCWCNKFLGKLQKNDYFPRLKFQSTLRQPDSRSFKDVFMSCENMLLIKEFNLVRYSVEWISYSSMHSASMVVQLPIFNSIINDSKYSLLQVIPSNNI